MLVMRLALTVSQAMLIVADYACMKYTLNVVMLHQYLVILESILLRVRTNCMRLILNENILILQIDKVELNEVEIKFELQG